jgi:sulfoxide reductase heme-binding subunit YedZ
VKRLGGLNWRRLHRLVYVASVAAILHFSWLAKKGRNEPYLYATILAALLGVRGWHRAARALGKRRVVALGAPSTQKRVAGAP